MTATKTPKTLKIQRRDYRFSFTQDAANKRWWHSGDPIPTAFYTALSATFPQGERFFIDSVKPFRHLADGELKQQVADFIFQESIHSREHVAFNKVAADAGYDMDKLEARTAKQIAIGRQAKPIVQLAATTSMEHFTAIMAAEVLKHPEHLKGMPPETERLWRWHAMEELEHKAVAFDVYLAATRNTPAFFRWLRRALVMFVGTILFYFEIFLHMRDLYREDGIDNRATWAATWRYLFGKPGLMRAATKDSLRYYKPGFHPWEADDSGLLDRARAGMTPPAPAAA